MDELLEPITIYHKTTTGWVKYHKMASLRNTSIRNRTNTGVNNIDNALIRVFDIDGYNNTYYVKKGDIIVKNHVTNDITSAPMTELRKLYGEENVYEVKSIDIFKFNDDDTKDLQHIKIGAI